MELSIAKVRSQLCKRATSSRRKRERAQEQELPRPAKSRELLLERLMSRPQTWIEEIALDRSMAATGGKRSRRMITLDLNHIGFQRAGRPERRRGDSKRKRKRVEDPGSTSMVVSWVELCKVRTTRGGRLDFECALGTHKGNYRRRKPPSQSQPKWWKAGQGAFRRDRRGLTTITWMLKEEDTRACQE